MMTKTNTKKSSTMARVALGATAALALAGHAHAAYSTCTGASTTAGSRVFNAVNNPDTTGAADACACAVGYSDGATNKGTATLSCTQCMAGYYLSGVGGATEALKAGAVCTQAPANTFHAGAGAITLTTAQTTTACPTYSTSVAGSSLLSSCLTMPGYYLKVGHATTAATVVIKQVSAGFYSVGNVAVTNTAATHVINADAVTHLLLAPAVSSGVTACPFGGTSAAGSNHQTDCTPDCATTHSDSNAVAYQGTCVCGLGSYGTITASNYPVGSRACTKCDVTLEAPLDGSLSTPETGATAVGSCVTAPGYVVTHLGTTQDLARTAKTPANTYAAGADDLVTGTVNNFVNCPAFSVSAEGSSKYTDCKCVAGYASTASTCAPCAGRAAGDSVGTDNTCPVVENHVHTSGASGASVFAAAFAVAAAQLVL